MPTKIYHNPRCSKSRQTLSLLNDNGIEPEIIEYLQKAPSVNELKSVLKLLGGDVHQIIRKKEALFKELELDKADLSNDNWIKVLSDNPKLIERPIVINDQKACIGRPPENVLDII